jgi:restriction system protein
MSVRSPRYGVGVRTDPASPRTALQWVGLWAGAAILFILVGLLNKAVWGLAVLAGLMVVASGWRWFLTWLTHRQAVRIDELYRASGQAAVDAMTGIEFEQYVAAVLRGVGYQVDMTKATGDFGVDLIATKGGVRTAVQCKRQARAVNGAAIQQVVAGAAVHDCTATMVVTNQRYTRAAEQLAAAHNCVLVDRTRLARLSRRR